MITGRFTRPSYHLRASSHRMEVRMHVASTAHHVNAVAAQHASAAKESHAQARESSKNDAHASYAKSSTAKHVGNKVDVHA
jgi:hypothetical protein